MMQCPPQIKDEISFGQRLADEAQRAREIAYALPPGKKRDALLEKARLADLGARINGWLAGPELAPVTVIPLRRRVIVFEKLAARSGRPDPFCAACRMELEDFSKRRDRPYSGRPVEALDQNQELSAPRNGSGDRVM